LADAAPSSSTDWKTAYPHAVETLVLVEDAAETITAPDVDAVELGSSAVGVGEWEDCNAFVFEDGVEGGRVPARFR
jgi:hypothetical protein